MPMLLSDYYDILRMPLNASLYEVQEKHKKLSRKYHPDKNCGNPKRHAKFEQIQEAFKVVAGYIEERREQAERREKEQYEKERLENEEPREIEDPEEEKQREIDERERKRKCHELFLKNNEAKIKATAQAEVERREGARVYMTGELLKICGDNVRHHTDDSGLEWYSVLDFIKQVHPNPGEKMKAVYKSWDVIKVNPKIKPFIGSTNRYAANNSMPEKTPAMTLWGLQMILTLLTEKKIRYEFENLARVAGCSYIPNPMDAT
jgi:curved DNA-binding protein CbpA